MIPGGGGDGGPAGDAGRPAVAAALRAVRQRIEAAAARARRDPAEVTLIGVTKTVEADRIRGAVAAGLRHLGENRVQEAAGKKETLGDLAGVTWHLIGHLQSNKAARAVELFDCIHSVDRAELARRLDRAAASRPAPLAVLVQVDLGHEPTKHGADESGLDDLVAEVASLPHLRLRGLMTIPPESPDPEDARPYFRRLRTLRDRLGLADLSMGMTGDFEVAVEEGSTLVRVGRALFGERPPMR